MKKKDSYIEIVKDVNKFVNKKCKVFLGMKDPSINYESIHEKLW